MKQRNRSNNQIRITYVIFIGLSSYLISTPVSTGASNQCSEENKIMKRNNKMNVNFKEDAKMAEIMLNYANAAISVAKDRFGIDLDWSDNSIKNVELILKKLHEKAKVDKPSEEDIYKFAQIFGSYVGQVFKQNHNAEWGIVDIENQQLPGLKTKEGQVFWPWGKANNRIVNGEEDNIFHYYQTLVKYKSQK